MEPEHFLLSSAFSGVDLPRSAIETLTTSGVPRELRLPDWAGPTLFTSELAAGKLVSTSEAGALVTRPAADESYILGSVRDTQGDAAAPYSVFALRRGSGEVYLLDAGDPSMDRFVNANMTAFLASLDAFHTAFPHMVDDTPEREKVVASFRGLLEKLDARALEDAHHYWPGWLEELE